MYKFKRVAKGEMYKIKMGPESPVFAILLITGHFDKNWPEAISYNFNDGLFWTRPKPEIIDDHDEKITDPAEKAYWLLRFENERSLG